MTNQITIPVFARIDEYAGLWLMSPQHFAAMGQAVRALDFRQHSAVKIEPLAVESVAAVGGQTISLLRLQGLLMKGRSSMGGTSTIEARREIRNAANDPNTAAIMLAIDSPGGTVAGTSDLADEIRNARKSKPVWAHIEDLGASAAYWAASQAERIFANAATALVGSIGTIQTVYDVSANFEKEGVKTFVFSTGPLKGTGAMGTKMTEEQAAYLQDLVDSMQASFDAGVKKGRNLTTAELNNVRHGGVFTASEAIKAKLIDGIQPLGKSINDLARSLTGGGSQRADVGPARVASPFPMVKLGTLPKRLEQMT